MRPLDSRYRPLLVALAAPHAAVAMEWLLLDFTDPFTWVFYYPAVFVAALVSGLRGGVVATLISALLAYWVFVLPQHAFQIHKVSALITTAVFVITGLLFNFFQERMRRLDQKASPQESEERFAMFMTALPAHAWMKDGQGRYAYANHLMRHEVMAGRKNYQGMADLVFFPPDAAPD